MQRRFTQTLIRLTLVSLVWTASFSTNAQNSSVVIDLARTANVRTIDGPTVDSDFARASLATGDFDGDGYTDVAIGAPAAAQTRGEVYVVFGSQTGIPSAVDLGGATPHLTLVGPTTGIMLGVALAAGDLDADGADELVVSSALYAAQYGRLASGGALIFRGQPSLRSRGRIDLVADRADAALFDSEHPAAIGASLCGADFNGDGYGDLAVGAPDSNGLNDLDEAGKVFVFPGRHDLPLGSAIDVSVDPSITVIGGLGAGDKLGTDIAGGDLSGDARDELILGTPNRTGTRFGRQEKSGEVFVVAGDAIVPGSAIDLSSDVFRLRIYSRDYGDYMGRGLAVGDLTGDRLDDLVIGLIDGDGPLNKREPDCGEIYVLESDTTRPDGTILDSFSDPYWQQVIGDIPKRFIGGSLAVGDLDGDRRPEIVTASPSSSTANGVVAGMLYVIEARAGVFDFAAQAPNVVVLGAEPNGNIGRTLAVVDLTGDGLPDIVAGAPGAAGRRGRLYVIPSVRQTPNVAPVFENSANLTIPSIRPSEFILSATDADGDRLRFAVEGRPDWVTFRDNVNGTATLGLQPPPGTTGAFEIRVSVSDGQATSRAALTITVSDVPPPVISKAVYSGAKLKITGTGFRSDAAIVVNGVEVAVPIAFKAAKNRLVVKATKAQLGLNDGAGTNRIVVVVDGTASQPFDF